MQEVFGLLDSLEATLLDGKKIMFTEKIVVDEHQILQLIDKIRLALKSNGDIVKKAVTVKGQDMLPTERIVEKKVEQKDGQAIVTEAEKYATEIKDGANEYSDYILANLQLLLTRMQKDLIKVEQTIDNGRLMIDKGKQDT